ncbi:RHS repeat-associated core domain-containing protein [Sphingobacterium alkalisoli]|uniref:RHS repeat-associated core domain-containing protein n=1 Tax=Sphingobacterium alkalisoli TaxID=1874115 RepID=A0A4U0GX17_9SPHI|nr:DUF6443 domain-containing protein [Sphingobacterium alkalisoli]TJY63546.1 RHS repeat-associated core domain-containing protein [Sphingobacterium alkalisoli]GGH26750.1 cell wall-associated protein [Sphingobacterium alkalisoli]
MKIDRILSLLLATVSVFLWNGTQGQTSNQNYTVETVTRRPYSSAASLTGKPVDSVNRMVRYYDGIGRPLQEIQWQGSTAKKDIVQHIEYDANGRESKKYLPYSEQTANNASFVAAAGNRQAAYYAGSGSWDTHVKKTAYPYTRTVFENSPLDRSVQTGFPGQIWQPLSDTIAGSGHTVGMEYSFNGTGEVGLWSMYGSSGVATSGDYPPGRLIKTTSYDENNPQRIRAGSIEEFRNLENRVVLRRIWQSSAQSLDTYYLYDRSGNLIYVIPPGVTGTLVSEDFSGDPHDVAFREYVYAYRYDGLNRLVAKKIPGKGWEWIVYNTNDQVVLTQDALQRSSGRWTYRKYDVLGREVSTGIYTNPALSTRELAQSAVEGVTLKWESRQDSVYSNTAFPTTGYVPHLVSYYDNYGFEGAYKLPASGISGSGKVKTLLTGTKVYKDDGTSPLLTVNYYDDQGRLIQSAGQNQFTGGTDYITNTYNFPGELLTSTRVHRPSASGTATTIVTTNSYDHVGRLKETRKKVNTQTEIVQSQLVYNEIGQLKQKNLHVNGATNQQEIYYTYNERGWTTGINNPNVLTDKRRFAMQLNYANNPQAYNGNIGSIVWNTKVTTTQTQTPLQSYIYTYDPLNRLKKAAYSATGKNNFFNEELAYDSMGNIDTLRRSSGSTGWYNHFKYSYTGNRLNGVADAGTAARGNTFTYDANGSAITNSRLGITNIEYNYLNLPRKFVKGAQQLLYTYDATGRKLTKQLGTGVTQYVDGIQYKNGVLEFIQTEEGRILPNGSSFIYEYFLKDHLGNTRAIIDHTGAVKQIQDYYAFGMEMNTGAGLNSAINLYKYSGKEKQTEIGLDQLDFGVRFYDAEIGRWSVLDPLAEAGFEISSYTYAFNNPILYTDPDGMWPDLPDLWKKFTNLFSTRSRTSVPNGNGNQIDYSIDLEPIDLAGPKRDPVSGFWGNVDYYLLGGNSHDGYMYDRQGNSTGVVPIAGIAPSPGMMKASPKDVLQIVNSIKNFLTATKTVGTALTKQSVIQGFKVSNHAWRKSGLGRGATEELISGVIDGAKKAGTVVPEVGTGQFAGHVIKVFNHNGIKVAVDETAKVIMSIRPEKGFYLP